MDVEPATMDDVERLADLWVELARDQRAHGSHLAAAPNRAAVRESIARHVVTGGLLVARLDDDGDPPDRVVGFVMFGPDGEGTYEEDVERGTIENIYVVPDRRGDGVGAELLETAESRLFESGADAVNLEVLADNDAARSFYRRAGYEPHRIELEKARESDTH